MPVQPIDTVIAIGVGARFHSPLLAPLSQAARRLSGGHFAIAARKQQETAMGNYRFIPSDRTTYAEELTAAYLDAQQSLGKNKCPRLMDIRISERVRAKQTETELHLAVELHPTHSSQPFHNHSMWLAAELLELIARFDLLRKARRRLLDAVAVQIDWIAFGERESADPYATAEAQLNVLAALDLLDSIDVNLTAAEQTLRVLKDERAESLDQLSLLYHRTCERLNSPKK